MREILNLMGFVDLVKSTRGSLLRGVREVGPMFKDSRGIGGGFAVKRGEIGCGSDEHEEHGEYSHTQQEVRGSFAHTGDRTGPAQPHGELGMENSDLPKGESSSKARP